MGEPLTPVKRITIPVYGAVDTTKVQQIIDKKEFQLLRWRKQLSLSEFVFPGATHTRFEHSLGVFAQCRKFTRPLVRKEMLTKQEAKDVEIAALLHDLGHGPYSHMLESVLRAYGSKFQDHNQRTGHLILGELAEQITACGSSPEKVLSIVNKKHPLSQLVSHKTIGSDKIAYVLIDQHHAGYPLGTMELGDLSENIIFKNGILGSDERMRHNLIQIQRYYFTVYSELYLRKQTKARERLFERAIQWALESGFIKADEVWDLPEYRLLTKLVETPGQWQKPMNDCFEGNWKALKAAVILRMPGDEGKEIIRQKKMKSLPVYRPEQFFTWFENPKNTLAAENAVSELLNIPLGDVALSCVGDPRRLLPEDVQVFDPGGNPIGTLFSRYPDHARSLQELARTVTAARVMVADVHREKASDAAQEISNLLHSLVK